MEEIEHIAKKWYTGFRNSAQAFGSKFDKNTLAHLDYLEHLVSIQRSFRLFWGWRSPCNKR